MRIPILGACCLLAACQAARPHDDTLFREHPPRSLLVLPPLDDTPELDATEVDATYAYLATVTRTLAERGYYVFPVALVDRLLREDGLSGPGEMHAAPLEHLREVFGADAVLYLTLHDWGTAYRVIDSSTEVTVEAHLVDTASGLELWSGTLTTVANSDSGQNGIIGVLVGSIVKQAATSASALSRDVARQCNDELFCDAHDGLPLGPYHADYGKEALSSVQR